MIYEYLLINLKLMKIYEYLLVTNESKSKYTKYSIKKKKS